MQPFYGLSLLELARPFDSVVVSMSEGIGGLAGAVLLGKQAFIEEAKACNEAIIRKEPEGKNAKGKNF